MCCVRTTALWSRKLPRQTIDIPARACYHVTSVIQSQEMYLEHEHTVCQGSLLANLHDGSRCLEPIYNGTTTLETLDDT